MVLVPVAVIGLEHDGVLLGGVGHQIGTIVGDVVGILAVQVGLGFRVVVRAELAALRGVIVTAQRSEHAVAQHGGEEGAGSGQGVLQGGVVNSLHAHGGEIGGFAVHVRFRAGDVAAFGAHQVFQTLGGVHHVLHAGNPVVRLDIGDLTALAVHPGHAFPDGEGVGQAVLADGVTGGQRGLLNIFFVIFEQAVIGVDDGAAVRLLGGGQHVPGVGVGAVGVVVHVGQLIALVRQVGLGLGIVFAGAVDFVPQVAQILHFVRLQDAFLDDDTLVHAVRVIAPQGGVDGTGSDPGNGIVAAPALQGDHHGGAQNLRLGDRHQGIPQAQVLHFRLGFGIVGVEIAQDGVVDLGGGSFISFHIHFGLRLSRQLSPLAQRHAAQHAQSENQGQNLRKLLHFFRSSFLKFILHTGRLQTP